MAEGQTTSVDPAAEAEAAKAAEKAAQDPKNWSAAKRQGASYIPPKAEYVAHGYDGDNYDAFVEEQTKSIKKLGLTPHSVRTLRPEGTHYVVTPALTAVRKGLNMIQRKSSFFSEAPRVMGKPMRRGARLVLTEAEMKMNALHIGRLHKNHAIEIHRVGENGTEVDLRDLLADEAKVDEKLKPISEVKAKTSKKDDSEKKELPKPEEVTGERLDATIEVAITPPPEALPEGPDPTVFPVNPAAGVTDTELDAATEVTGQEEGATVAETPSSKKKGKKAKKEE